MIPFLHIGIAISLLSIVLILIKRPFGISDKIALTLVVFLAIPMLFKLIILGNFHVDFPNGFLSIMSCPLTYGPLVYLYIIFQTVSIPAFKKKYLLHFVPFILFAVISFIAAELNPQVTYTDFGNNHNNHERPPQFANEGSGPPHGMNPVNPDILFPTFDSWWNSLDYLYFILLYSSFVFYTFLILRHFYKREGYDLYGKLNYIWLEILTLFFVLSYLFVLLLFIIPEDRMNSVFNSEKVPDISIMCFIFVFCISFNQKNISNKKADIDSNDNRKYKKSGLKVETANKLISDLEKYMNEEKPYLDSELTFDYVSQKLCVPKHYITQIINENLNKNFSTYINEYRVEEAKRMLTGLGSKYYSVIDVAYEAGFNSKSTFNLVFKKITGITPSQFKRQKRFSFRNLEKEYMENKTTTPLLHGREEKSSGL